MRSIIFLLAIAAVPCLGLSTSVAASKRVVIDGGQRIALETVSYVAPVGHQWTELSRTGERVVVATQSADKNALTVISLSRYPLPKFATADIFLAHVQSGRVVDKNDKRFEVIADDMHVANEREQMCVRLSRQSKDFGVAGDKDDALIQYNGITCVLPSRRSAGIFVEVSHRAKPNYVSPTTNKDANALFESLQFSPAHSPAQ